MTDTAAAAAAGTPLSPSAAAAAVGSSHGQQHWASLKQKMGLPEGPLHLKEKELPVAPIKSLQVGHTPSV
jgi:hypothetical protein